MLGDEQIKVTVNLDREAQRALDLLKRYCEGNQSQAVRYALKLAAKITPDKRPALTA